MENLHLKITDIVFVPINVLAAAVDPVDVRTCHLRGYPASCYHWLLIASLKSGQTTEEVQPSQEGLSWRIL